MRRRGQCRLVEVRVERFGGRSSHGIQATEPVEDVLTSIVERRAHQLATSFPQLQVHRLGQRHAETRILTCGERAVGKRGQGRCPKRSFQALGDRPFLQWIYPDRANPVETNEETSQCKEMVVLALDPEPAAAETVQKMSQKPARALH